MADPFANDPATTATPVAAAIKIANPRDVRWMFWHTRGLPGEAPVGTLMISILVAATAGSGTQAMLFDRVAADAGIALPAAYVDPTNVAAIARKLLAYVASEITAGRTA